MVPLVVCRVMNSQVLSSSLTTATASVQRAVVFWSPLFLCICVSKITEKTVMAIIVKPSK